MAPEHYVPIQDVYFRHNVGDWKCPKNEFLKGCDMYDGAASGTILFACTSLLSAYSTSRDMCIDHSICEWVQIPKPARIGTVQIAQAMSTGSQVSEVLCKCSSLGRLLDLILRQHLELRAPRNRPTCVLQNLLAKNVAIAMRWS